MKNHPPLFDAAARSAAAVWHRLGRPLATAAIGIAVALAIIHGESWALRQEPSLLLDSALSSSVNVGCRLDDGAATSVLPVATLH